MDFLNKSFRPLIELFGSMTPAARITAGLLLAVVAISLTFLVRSEVTTGNTYLYGGREFSQDELGAMEEALALAGIRGNIVGFRISVPSAKTTEALTAILQGNATPRGVREAKMDESGLTNPLISGRQIDSLNEDKKERKIAQMIQAMSDVEQVHVEIDEQVSLTFPRVRRQTAAVIVKKRGNQPLAIHEARAIRATVQHAIAGLKDSDISIVDRAHTQTFAGTPEGQLPSPGDNPYVTTKKWWEDYWREKLEERLSFCSAQVAVNVKIDPTLNHSEDTKELDKTPTTLVQSQNKRDSRSEKMPQEGRPGAVPNTGTPNGTASVAQTKPPIVTVDNESKESSEAIVGGTLRSKTMAPLVPTEVRVSIGIPESHYLKMWNKSHPTAEGEVPVPMDPAWFAAQEETFATEVQEIVRPLLNEAGSIEDPYEFIVVRTNTEAPEESFEEPALSDHALSWLAGNWQVLGLLMVGAFALMVLRGTIKSALPKPEEPNAAAGALDDIRTSHAGEEGESDTDEAEPLPNSLKKRFGHQGRDLRDELSELVQEDPDAAASVLQSWIGDAA